MGAVIFFLPTMLLAQKDNSFEFLSIDRPDISNLPTTILPGHFQFELGLEFGQNDFAKDKNLPNFLLRTGLSKRLEFRLGVNHLQVDSSEAKGLHGAVVNTLSIKYRLVEEKGYRPSIAIQPDVNFGFIKGPNAGNPSVDYALILLFNNTLHDKIFFNYNAGVFFIDDATEYLVSGSVSFMHTHRLGYFFEVYQIAEQLSLRHLSVDGGITFLVRPRLQLDVYVGRQDVKTSDRLYFGLGAGFRLDRGDLKGKTFHDIGIHH